MLPIAILAGGYATRIKPISDLIPKALVEFNNKPFLEWQLQLIEKNNGNLVVLCVSHKSEMIKAFIDNRPKSKLEIVLSHDGEKQLGTGGALIKASEFLGNEFLVLYGDSYLPIDFHRVSDYFQKSNKLGLMTVLRNTLNLEPSNVVYDNGWVRRYDKKRHSADMQYVDFGLNAFNSNVFTNYTAGEYVELSAIQSSLATRNELVGYEVNQRFYEVGSFQGMIDFQEYVKGI
jgi:MurNAc alpha-1-phosphate uridylyltransferase